MQHSYYLNSTHAVKVTADGRETVLAADEHGNITVEAGDVLVFKSPNGKKNINVDEIVFRTGEAPLRLMINDNAMYPYIVPADSQQGISGMPVYRLTVLNGCTFAYEALA